MPGNKQPESGHESEQIFIIRQPIFDSTEKVIGYHLLPKNNSNEEERNPNSSLRASAQLLSSAFNQFGLEQILGDKLAFIPVSTEALSSDLLKAIPPHKIVLDIQPSELEAAEFIDVIRKLHQANYKFSLTDFTYSQELAPLYEMASYVTHDIHAVSMDVVQDQILLSYHLPIKHIATNLQSYGDFQQHKKSMFTLYQGQQFAPYDSLTMNRFNPSSLRVMQLFNMVMNQSDLTLIEDHFKHDIALSYSLLCYLNSAGYGMPFKVESIRSAIMLLGYNFLARWLSLLLFAGADVRAGQRVLINTALIRGRLMELLGEKILSSKDSDRLFMTGIFSMLDSFLGIPMEKALQNLQLPETITQALLFQEGEYAPMLALAMAFETSSTHEIATLCTKLSITPNEANLAHLAAIEWSRKLGQP